MMRVKIKLGNIIAKKSGIVTKIIAENGTAKLHEGSYIEEGMTAIEGIVNSEFIDPIYVHASGILRIKNTYVYEIEEKYTVNEKIYTGNKKIGIGMKINNKEYLLKYLPKEHIYDINKKGNKIKLGKNSFEFLFIKYIEYEMMEKQRTYEELCEICKEKYDKYMENMKVGSNVVSNEKIDVIDTGDGIKYTVAYDLEEDAGVFKEM